MPGELERDVVIVGAGVAGLVLGRQLVGAGVPVTVIEKAENVGGLARSLKCGDFVFDVGPHRFHTEDLGVMETIKSVLGDDYIQIPRRSAVWMFGKFIDWPVRPSGLLAMPPSLSIRALKDLLYWKREKIRAENFETYTRSMYGDTLYRAFFEPYTRKFTGLPASRLDITWAKAGIERAVIDRRIRMHSLRDLFKGLLLPVPVNTEFLYPASGGIGVFCKRLQAEIESCGGRVICGAGVTSLSVSNGRVRSVTADREEYPVSRVVWTASLADLLTMLGMPRPKLHYLSLVCVNMSVAHPPRQPYQWIYVGEGDAVLSRVSVPSLFNPSLAPTGKHGLCAEVTYSPEKGVPEDINEQCLHEVISMGLVDRPSDVSDINVLHVENAYPRYAIGFKKTKAASIASACSVTGLSVLGRTACFWYNNMDHSIHAALRHADMLLNHSIGPLSVPSVHQANCPNPR